MNSSDWQGCGGSEEEKKKDEVITVEEPGQASETGANSTSVADGNNGADNSPPTKEPRNEKPVSQEEKDRRVAAAQKELEEAEAAEVRPSVGRCTVRLHSFTGSENKT